jgi:hypothetical protein
MSETPIKLKYDTPMSRLIEAREHERLAANPPITDPKPFTLDQMNRLSDLDKIQISHFQKNNPNMSREQCGAYRRRVPERLDQVRPPFAP